MRRWLLVLCLLAGGCQPAPVKPQPTINDAMRVLEKDTRQIARVRPAGSTANRQVRDYLSSELWKAGFRITPQTFDRGVNIVGTRRGLSDRTILLGAHYDSVLCPGADDNASGCAVVLAAARALAHQRLQHSLTVVFFDAEEDGLVGSRYYANRMKEQCVFMVNLDMVGHLRIAATAPVDDTLNALFRKYPWARNISFRDDDRSDHASFSAKGIPVLWVFTGEHAAYHQPTDVPSTLNYRGMAHITQYVRDVVLTFDKQPDEKFTYGYPILRTYRP